MQRIPYLKFLAMYYDVIRKFVAAVAPEIDKKEWTVLSTVMKDHVPGFEKVNMIDAISTFIHQVRNIFQRYISITIHFCH